MRRRALLAAALTALVLAVTGGCRVERPGEVSGQPGDDVVTVASFNFPESVLLAEIYAQAIESVGVRVQRELSLGPRELVLPALQQGRVDVVPEYLGSALTTLARAAQRAERGAALAALRTALRPWRLLALEPAPAQNQNAFAVTAATAARLSLREVSDLRRDAARLTLGGPFECRTRPYCLPGLERVYGLRFARFQPLDSETQRATALLEGVVDVAVVFSTEGRLAAGQFVVLDDDRHLQPPENVVPVVSERAVARFGPRLTAVLDRVSAALTTRGLVLLNWRTGVGHREVASEARGWLRRHGVVRPAS